MLVLILAEPLLEHLFSLLSQLLLLLLNLFKKLGQLDVATFFGVTYILSVRVLGRKAVVENAHQVVVFIARTCLHRHNILPFELT